jgi:hypothetical protein
MGKGNFPFSILRCREQGIKTTLKKYKIWKKKGDRKGVEEEFVKQQLFAESKTGRKQKQRDTGVIHKWKMKKQRMS